MEPVIEKGIDVRSLQRLPLRLAWESRRAAKSLMRWYGVWSLLVPASLAMALLGIWWEQKLAEATAGHQSALWARPAALLSPPVDSIALNRERLQAFDKRLLSVDEVPGALQELLDQAEKNGLVLRRAEYQLHADQQGRFVRYRMLMPVKGKPESIQNFLTQAWTKQRALVLESIQFKRDQPGQQEIEARIQCVLLVRSDDSAIAQPSAPIASGGRQ